MPSRSKLSEMMKGAYSVPKDVRTDLKTCLNGLWNEGASVNDTKTCERQAMSKVAEAFAAKWTA